MEKQEIEVGSVVFLKSGGPLMTVSKIDGDVAHSVYFEGCGDHDHLMSIDLPTACLALVGFTAGGDGDDGEAADNVVDFEVVLEAAA